MIRTRSCVVEQGLSRHRFVFFSGGGLALMSVAIGFLAGLDASSLQAFESDAEALPTVPWPEAESAARPEGVAVLPVMRVSPDETLAVPICVANLREKPRVYWADWPQNTYSVGWFPELVSLRTGKVFRRSTPPGSPAKKTRLTLLPARSATLCEIDLSSFHQTHRGSLEPGRYLLRVAIDVPEGGALAMSGLKPGRASLPVAILDIQPQATRAEAGFTQIPASWGWLPLALVMGGIAAIVLSRRLRLGRKPSTVTVPSGG